MNYPTQNTPKSVLFIKVSRKTKKIDFGDHIELFRPKSRKLGSRKKVFQIDSLMPVLDRAMATNENKAKKFDPKGQGAGRTANILHLTLRVPIFSKISTFFRLIETETTPNGFALVSCVRRNSLSEHKIALEGTE